MTRVLHVSLFGSPRFKRNMRQFNLKTFILASNRLEEASKTPSKSTLNTPNHHNRTGPPWSFTEKILRLIPFDSFWLWRKVSFFSAVGGFGCWGNSTSSVTWNALSKARTPGVFDAGTNLPKRHDFEGRRWLAKISFWMSHSFSGVSAQFLWNFWTNFGSILDKSHGWITPKHKTKSQQFRFYLFMPSPTDFGSFTFPDVHHFSHNLSHKNGIVYSCW